MKVVTSLVGREGGDVWGWRAAMHGDGFSMSETKPRGRGLRHNQKGTRCLPVPLLFLPLILHAILELHRPTIPEKGRMDGHLPWVLC